MVTQMNFSFYCHNLIVCLENTLVSAPDGEVLLKGKPVTLVSQILVQAGSKGGKTIIIGNGGSAAIASHVAIDLSKNAGVRAMAFNDPSALTCLANDYGFEHVFSKQIEYHASAKDVLIAISSSGKSEDILRAVQAARTIGCAIITFSGFYYDNPLRKLGDMNFYVPADRYGYVELSHMVWLHAIIDEICDSSSS
jgi:D-sedoheptulose 7-phosphate isomerase